MQVRCPACGRIAEYENNPYRPFCSGICKNNDVISWADGAYRITGPEVPVSELREDDGKLSDNS